MFDLPFSYARIGNRCLFSSLAQCVFFVLEGGCSVAFATVTSPQCRAIGRLHLQASNGIALHISDSTTPTVTESPEDLLVSPNQTIAVASVTMPYTMVNGHRIHYFDIKDFHAERGERKPPVIMIHGLGSSQNYYMSVIPELQEYRCIALSTYGAALSKSKGEELSLEQLADDVVGVMDNLEIPKAVIAGHSMGGPMALTVAAKHPDRVVGVVGIGPVNPTSVKPEMFTQRIDTVMKGVFQAFVQFHGIPVVEK